MLQCGRRRRNFDVAGGLLVSWFIVLEKKQKNGTVSYHSVDLFSVFIITYVKKKWCKIFVFKIFSTIINALQKTLSTN